MNSTDSLFSTYVSTNGHPDYSDKLRTFGQFVGTWDIDLQFFDDDGKSIFRGPGEWCFAWVMDGRILQDVMTFSDLKDPALTEPGKRNIGSSIRQYIPKTDTWNVVWIGASSGNFCVLHVVKEGEDLVLERNEEGVSRLRWKFSNITQDTFHWTGHYSKDDGETWILEQEMFAKKRI